MNTSGPPRGWWPAIQREQRKREQDLFYVIDPPYGGLRVEKKKDELVHMECGCWYQQRGLYLVRFRACDGHTLDLTDWSRDGPS